MRTTYALIIFCMTGLLASEATIIRAPSYDILNVDVNHVVLGTITNVKTFDYDFEGKIHTCAVELSVEVHKDRKNISRKLKLLTIQTAIEYVVGREYLFISSKNELYDEKQESDNLNFDSVLKLTI